MKEDDTRKFAIITIFLAVIILSFLMVKSLLISVIVGFILAYIFNPVYKQTLKFVKYKSLAAILICIFVLLIIVTPIWFLAPSIIKQTSDISRASQQIDFLTTIKNQFPQLFTSEEFTQEISRGITLFISKTTSSLMNTFSDILLNLPVILLKLMIVFFIFFYTLRDQDKIFCYLKSISPFDKDMERKFANYSSAITSAVIYGQVIVGILQGLIVGFGLFIFHVPNFLFLTLIAMILGIMPIIGPPLVYIPAMFYLFLSGNPTGGIGMAVIGAFSSTFDNILRPIIVSRRTKVHTSIILVGMIGGFLFIGTIGLIIGPLILAYGIILLELFKKKDTKGGFIEVCPTE